MAGTPYRSGVLLGHFNFSMWSEEAAAQCSQCTGNSLPHQLLASEWPGSRGYGSNLGLVPGYVDGLSVKPMFTNSVGILSKTASLEKRSPDRLATEFMLTAMSLVAGLISAVSESPSGTVISEKGITSRHVDHGVASKSLAFFFYTLLI